MMMITTTLMIHKKVKMCMEERITILDHENEDSVRDKREADNDYDDDDYDDNEIDDNA